MLFRSLHGRKPLVLVGLAVSGLGTAALGFSGSVPVFLAVSLVAGVGAGLLNPAQNAAVADLVGAKGKGGPVLAAFQMSADVGSILGPLVTGVLADLISYRAAFAVTGLTAVLALAAWFAAPETSGRRGTAEPARTVGEDDAEVQRAEK